MRTISKFSIRQFKTYYITEFVVCGMKHRYLILHGIVTWWYIIEYGKLIDRFLLYNIDNTYSLIRHIKHDIIDI